MAKTVAVNDSTLQDAGKYYQHLIALRDCFELEEGESLEIEIHGDVSIIGKNGGKFQKEVKHHFANTNLTERHIDFWKTLANWYVDYEKIKIFHNLILHTTAIIALTSPFCDWNNITKEKKYKIILDIGQETKKREKEFREQYQRIFNSSFNESHLLEILDRFTIEQAQEKLAGVSNSFAKYVGHIPPENRDAYISALHGLIDQKVTVPPHKWSVTRAEFEQMLQRQTAAYGTKGSFPLPTKYSSTLLTKEQKSTLSEKQFVQAIREIQYQQQIPRALTDYWKTSSTIYEYFQNNPWYIESLEEYEDSLYDKLGFAKDGYEIDAENQSLKTQISASKHLYTDVMMWDANDFGSIVHNQGFFQRGVIHRIVDKGKFSWRVGDATND